MNVDLDTSELPDLPQTDRLRSVVHDLWREPEVVALWIGGSLARGAGDPYSDVDLRIAVSPTDAIETHVPPPARQLIAASVACIPVFFGNDAMLYHLMLENGEIYDLFLQTTDREPTNEARLVLGCRDAAFGAKLLTGTDPSLSIYPADPETIRQLIASFWIGQQKHQKALHRGLPLVSWVGEQLLHNDLIRLWYCLATGNDCGSIQRMTIHTLSPVMRTVQQVIGDRALAIVGQPLRSDQEIIASTMRLQDEVSRVGRQLAAQLGFSYPEAAEATVRHTWQQFCGQREDAAAP